MADFNNPKNTNPLLNLFGYVREGFTSLAKMFDGTTDSNITTGAKKIDGSTKVVSQWNGSSWDAIGSVAGITAVDADSVTVSNLETDNFKSGTIVTTVGSTGSDTAIPTEQAVRESITNKIPIDVTVPTISLEGFDGTTTTLYGYYYKIGKLAFIGFYLEIATVGTSSANEIKIDGFGSVSVNRSIGPCYSSAINNLAVEVPLSGTALKILRSSGAYATYGDIGLSRVTGIIIAGTS